MLVAEVPLRRKYHEVRIGIPEPDADGDWRCAYHIRGIGMRSCRYAFGIDSLQALILALGAIRHDLLAAGIACHWIGGERGDPGLPRFVPTEFGLAVSRPINRLIDRELSRYAKSLEADAKRRMRRRTR